MLMWVLTLHSPEGERREYTLKPGKNSLGRKSDNDIVVADISASRRHAEITYDLEQDQLIINDLESTNGTFVNRERLDRPIRLENNDVIRIGGHIISVTSVEAGQHHRPAQGGTRPLTRDLLLESVDQHAILMYEVARQLNTMLDTNAALEHITNLIKRSMGADYCVVAPRGQTATLVRSGVPQPVIKLVLEEKSAVLLPDPALNITDELRKQNIESAICVPIIGGDIILGLIYIAKSDPLSRPFTQRDLQLVITISHQTALTLQRTQLIQKIQDEQRVRQVLQRFLSPQQAEYALQNYFKYGQLPELEEHQATVLFSDMADSTGIAERMGVERFGKLLRRYYQDMTDIVFDNGGMLDKFLGDGIMAIFGMNDARPDPEVRAVTAGLQMVDAIQLINQDFPNEEIQIGVGINSGLVVAGYVSTRQRVELTILGDTVNVAARMENYARPNRVLIGPPTMAAVVGKFRTQRIGAITVKGRTRPIQAHEVIH
ncbi:MAG: adenylate/guanylate cyclase domain-containing protein [Anaerolineales bacterium]